MRSAGKKMEGTRSQTDAARSQHIEEYLEALFKLERTNEGITVSRLAAELGVKPSSASQMLTRLTEAGLVARGRGGRLRLTRRGALEGSRLVRRHRLSERFLADLLRLPWDKVHDEACKFEHVLSPEVEARLAEQLGHPLTCPHGHSIPGEDGTLVEAPARPLSELKAGDNGVIARVSDEAPDLLRYLASLGLMPEALIRVESVAPFGGPHLIRIGDAQYAIGREVAAKVLVHSDE
jgi:DtxR family transcriptional regulator, Mn-dependent transcriptional regulator